MKYIGAHVPANGGVASTPIIASQLGMKAFALFTRNPSRWKASALTQAEADTFRQNCADFGYSPDHILPHDSFLINLGSPEVGKLRMSRDAFLDEMRRCELLGLTMINFHPGSHLNIIPEEQCLRLISDSLNMALDKTSTVTAVIESTAGQGSNLGFRFEQIAEIIEHIEDKSRIGVCIDTCHSFAAGYDLSTPEGYKKTWDEFDEIIGFNRLRGMHLNDSKKGLGSRVDRHAPIGQGTLGLECFRLLMNDPRMDEIPMILETPDDAIWTDEISLLYSMRSQDAP